MCHTVDEYNCERNKSSGKCKGFLTNQFHNIFLTFFNGAFMSV